MKTTRLTKTINLVEDLSPFTVTTIKSYMVDQMPKLKYGDLWDSTQHIDLIGQVTSPKIGEWVILYHRDLDKFFRLDHTDYSNYLGECFRREFEEETGSRVYNTQIANKIRFKINKMWKEAIPHLFAS